MKARAQFSLIWSSSSIALNPIICSILTNLVACVLGHEAIRRYGSAISLLSQRQVLETITWLRKPPVRYPGGVEADTFG